jgi:hypothetical protein
MEGAEEVLRISRILHEGLEKEGELGRKYGSH